MHFISFESRFLSKNYKNHKIGGKRRRKVPSLGAGSMARIFSIFKTNGNLILAKNEAIFAVREANRTVPFLF